MNETNQEIPKKRQYTVTSRVLDNYARMTKKDRNNEIFDLYNDKEKNMSMREIAEKYGITQARVSFIIKKVYDDRFRPDMSEKIAKHQDN